MDNILTAQLLAAQEASVFYTDIKSENRLQIDWETRSIIVPEDMRIIGVQFDHLANKVTFEMDRYLDGVDLSEHTIAVHFINAGEWFGADRDYSDAGSGVYPITSIDLSTEGKLICEWDVSNAATQIAGIVAFALHIYTIVDGAYTYHLGTKPAVTELPGSINSTEHGSNVVPPEVEVYIQQMQDLSDEIDQSIKDFTADMDAKMAEAEALTERAEAAAEKLVIDDALSFNSENAVQNKLIAPVLDSLDRHKASAIIQSSSGKVIPINGSAKARFPGMRQFGGSEQRKTTGAQLLSFNSKMSVSAAETFVEASTYHSTLLEVSEGESYYLSCTNYGAVNNAMIRTMQTAEVPVVGGTYERTNYFEDGEITIGSGMKYLVVQISPLSTYTLDDIKKNSMLNAGTEPLPWEPYTGNAPSPSPEYPQQIVNAGQMLCEGWQLLDLRNYSVTRLGVTVTGDSDGRITLSGTPTGDGAVLNINLNNSGYEAGTYMVSYESGIPNNVFTRMVYRKSESDAYTYVPSGTSVTLDDFDTYANINYHIVVSSVDVALPTTIYPMLNVGNTAKPWEPYTGGVKKTVDIPIETEVCGKNLFDLNKKFASYDMDGDWFKVNKDNTSGTSVVYGFYNLYPSEKLQPNTEYLIVAEVKDWSGTGILKPVSEADSYTGQFIGLADTITTNGIYFLKRTTLDSFDDCLTMLRTAVIVEAGNSVSFKFRISVLADTTITAENFVYEPYSSQPLTYTKEGGFPGIEVTDASLATYTDEDGKMWCADYRDWERGVDVKRVYTEVVTEDMILSIDNTYATSAGTNVNCKPSQYVYASNTKIAALVCDCATGVTFEGRNDDNNKKLYRCYLSQDVSNRVILRYPVSVGEKTLEEAKADFAGATVAYILATPIETPIPEEELAAYRALHSNYPNTTIFSDVHTEVETVMDTQMYIDKKFAELAAAMVAGSEV